MSFRASPSPRAAEPNIEACAGAISHSAISAPRPPLELRADAGEQLDRRRSEMLALEPVQIRLPRSAEPSRTVSSTEARAGVDDTKTLVIELYRRAVFAAERR